MNHSSYLACALWKDRESCKLTDITLVCEDGSTPAHSAVLSVLFTHLGLTFPSRAEVPDCLLLPDLSMTQIKLALKHLYLENRVESLMELLTSRHVAVKEESKDTSDTKKIKYESCLEKKGSSNDEQMLADQKVDDEFLSVLTIERKADTKDTKQINLNEIIRKGAGRPKGKIHSDGTSNQFPAINFKQSISSNQFPAINF